MQAHAVSCHGFHLAFKIPVGEIAVRYQQYAVLALLGLTGEKDPGPFQGLPQAAALQPDQVARDGWQDIPDSLAILRDRGHHVGHGGKGNEADAHLAIPVDQILDLLSGTAQAGGLHIRYFHGAGDVQEYHQIGAGPEQLDLGVVQTRSGHGDRQR